MNEALDLIARIHAPQHGRIYRFCAQEHPAALKLVDNDYAYWGDEEEDSFRLNYRGKKLLQPVIDHIMQSFICYAEENDNTYSEDGVINWFTNLYAIDGNLAAALYEFASKNLQGYGYRIVGSSHRHSESDCRFEIEKITMLDNDAYLHS